MAEDKSLVAQYISLQMISQIPKLIEILNIFVDLENWARESSIVFTNYDVGDDIELFGSTSENLNLKHVNGAMLNTLLGSVMADENIVNSIMHHLINTTVSSGTLSGKTYWQILQMVRRNQEQVI